MKIQTGATLAIIVSQQWARLHGIIQFLGNQDHPDTLTPHRGDGSHVLYAKVLDDEDSRGLWVELNTARDRNSGTTTTGAFLIPWNQVLGIAVMQHRLCPAGETARRALDKSRVV